MSATTAKNVEDRLRPLFEERKQVEVSFCAPVDTCTRAHLQIQDAVTSLSTWIGCEQHKSPPRADCRGCREFKQGLEASGAAKLQEFWQSVAKMKSQRGGAIAGAMSGTSDSAPHKKIILGRQETAPSTSDKPSNPNAALAAQPVNNFQPELTRDTHIVQDGPD